MPEFGDSQVVQWLGLCFHCRGAGSVLGQGTKMLHAAQCHQQTNGQDHACVIDTRCKRPHIVWLHLYETFTGE